MKTYGVGSKLLHITDSDLLALFFAGSRRTSRRRVLRNDERTRVWNSRRRNVPDHFCGDGNNTESMLSVGSSETCALYLRLTEILGVTLDYIVNRKGYFVVRLFQY